MNTSPIVKVTLEQADGSAVEYVVQTDNRDRVKFDLISNSRGWPSAQTAPTLWITVLAWNALRRSDVDLDMHVDKFIDKCIDVHAVNENGDRLTRAQLEAQSAEATPTKPDHESGY